MRTALSLTLTLLFSAVAAAQSVVPGARIAEGFSARLVATDLLRAGNAPAALAQLRAAAAGRAMAMKSRDSLVVDELCTISRTLAVERHPAARDAVVLAAEEAKTAVAQLGRAEAAQLEAAIGELYERCLGEGAVARRYYQSALALDATRREAVDGLKRLDRVVALARAKESENAALRAGRK
jgi:hypothetical protein